MSLEAILAVLEHSPYKLATRLVHIAIADTVHADHGYLYWAGDATAARKALVDEKTVRRAKATMVDDGTLEDLGRHEATGNRLYRFIVPRPDKLSTGSPPDISDDPPDNLTPTDRTNPDPHCLSTEMEQKENGRALAELDPIDLLCDLLADAMAHYAGNPSARPNPRAESWRKPMRLLVERGPNGRDKPEQIPVERVANAIRFIFENMAMPRPGSDFCWAKVIQSPSNLRDKWDRILLDARALLTSTVRAGAIAGGDNSAVLEEAFR